MQKNPSSHSGFFHPRALLAFVLCGTACSILTGTLLGFLRSESPTGSERTLTFAERVAYQRIIEDVYWRHRIWPKERPDPKPPLDAVMSQAQLEKKVTDYLRKSQALENYWQRPITREQLQAEMDRMAKHTRQPEVLQELFEALGNDPFVIAECLARPALADRLLTNWYPYDQRIHGDLKKRAEAQLQAHPRVEQMKQLSGNYSEIELIRSDSGHNANRRAVGHGVQLNNPEWDETVQKLAAMFGDRSVGAGVSPAKAATGTQIKTRVLSALQEEDMLYYATAVIEKTDEHLKIATVSWLKEPFESWLSKAENQVTMAIVAPNAKYILPKISEGSACLDDTWTTTSGPPDTRPAPTAVWTGTEMIVWGGWNGTFNYFSTGGRYSPTTDTWTATSIASAPTARYGHTAVWSGNEMIVWGGFDGVYTNTGGRYNPGTNAWTPTNTSNAPTARSLYSAVWTGNVMIVWGGYDGTNVLNTGGRYNPVADSWNLTSTTDAPSARDYHTAVWSGSEMIIWGGFDPQGNTGGRYNPDTDSWVATSIINAPDGRGHHSAVWTGNEMIVWGGDNGGVPLNSGGRYNPATNSWTATSVTNAPLGRSSHTAVWTSNEMIVWGGFIGGGDTNTGGKYNPTTNSWIATSITNAPVARAGHAAIWSGSEMILWGGSGNAASIPDIGGRYDPSSDSWTPTGHSPTRRAYHAAVWTGSEMIVWGGIGTLGYLDSGGKYDVNTDSWVPTTTTNAPTGRELPTAVWTGTEMIIWAGYSYDGLDHYWNTGGRYNPGLDSWTATSTANAPVGRELHTAVWTGSAMIVWGGYYADPFAHDLNTGGIYNPGTNSWTSTSTTNSPSARDSHAAVWTGSEMIVWGGPFFDASGGRYNPSTNTWVATSTINAPTGRASPKAVWTGSQMIAWAGYYYDGTYHYLNTGGRYNPNTDNWTATSITDAPEARTTHTAVWTGDEMIVWGGQAGFIGQYFNTGGRYDPSTDIWTATSTDNVPDGRYRHTAVWTGDEMIVWGGIRYSNGYTGTGGRYCAQSGPPPSPTPTPTPCSGRCSPTPRPRPTPAPRPSP